MPQANSFSGVRVDSTGTASVVPGAPFSAPSGTLSVAAHGKFVFTSAIFPNDSSSQILGYQVDTSTGALTQVSSNQSTTGRAYLALDPSGNYLYAGLYGAGKLYGYHVETSGALTPLAGSPWTLQAESAAYARVTPDGKYVCYADTGGRGAGLINCVQRDPSSGEIPNSTSFLGTAVSNTPFTSFDFTPDGAYLVATEAGISNNVSVFPFQPFGQPAQGTAVQTAATPLAVTVNPGGNLVAVTDQAGTLYLYSRSNGALNRLSSNAVPGHIGTYADFLAFSSSGQYLFVGSGNGVVVYHVDPATGFLSAVSGSPVNIGGLSGPIGAL